MLQRAGRQHQRLPRNYRATEALILTASSVRGRSASSEVARVVAVVTSLQGNQAKRTEESESADAQHVFRGACVRHRVYTTSTQDSSTGGRCCFGGAGFGSLSGLPLFIYVLSRPLAFRPLPNHRCDQGGLNQRHAGTPALGPRIPGVSDPLYSHPRLRSTTRPHATAMLQLACRKNVSSGAAIYMNRNGEPSCDSFASS